MCHIGKAWWKIYNYGIVMCKSCTLSFTTTIKVSPYNLYIFHLIECWKAIWYFNMDGHLTITTQDYNANIS